MFISVCKPFRDSDLDAAHILSCIPGILGKYLTMKRRPLKALSTATLSDVYDAGQSSSEDGLVERTEGQI
jgi:hypothetical protein